MRIGVLAIQGDVREHLRHTERAGAEAREVRLPRDLDDINGLIMPGGESTTIGMLMAEYGLIDALKERTREGRFPIYGTCAGLILLARDVVGPSPARLGYVDIEAARNAYGRQVASFEVGLDIPCLGSEPFPAVFIRAPKITRLGPDVTPLARYQGEVVMAEQGPYLVSSFHPEMSPDIRIHEYFIKKVESLSPVREATS
ncbi:pyridoxal 5'-phosphate synthase glutaminase subunit PdxT [Sulfobacillus harzensis]|uniref:Pyridoxal 5'-phosphate synthase subunit PdxT n=1 Tax=Sulfobacillus harzensis TaxID=2729629 RepID=A0A7Y0L0Q7_9FIRM|nr:pyridoxal 5'-phosphate synthase glutaminase subunit PdxT [Sulfobacillus harzensis]NMP20908.1 pyridoxal 5'-phosphate synthase glutaminase subunit PdxT [Sulfobacillus harzensis]